MRKDRLGQRTRIERYRFLSGMLVLCCLLFMGGMTKSALAAKTTAVKEESEAKIWYPITMEASFSYKTEDEKREENDGTIIEINGVEGSVSMEVYVPASMRKDGSIRTSGNVPVTEEAPGEMTTMVSASDLGLEGVEGAEASYYKLPSGYRVAANASVYVVRRITNTKETPMTADNVYTYQKTTAENGGSVYQEVSFKKAIEKAVNEKTSLYVQTYQVTGTVEFGAYWNVKSIKVTGYTSSTLDTEGKELVGTTLDKKNFTVMAVISDGKSIQLPVNYYEIDITTIPKEKASSQRVKFSYFRNTSVKDVSYDIPLTVEKFLRLEASCNKGYYVGDTINKSDINLSKVYIDVSKSDTQEQSSQIGSSYFTISPETVTNIGTNTVTIKYLNTTTTVQVTGYGVEKLEAVYSGGDVIVGQQFDTSKVRVVMTYTDGKSVTLSQNKDGYTFGGSTTVYLAGENTFTVTYQSYTAVFKVPGIARVIRKLEAEYTGPNILVGYSFLTTDVKVKAIYNDDTEEQVYNFLLSATTAAAKGANKITVTYEGTTAVITVNGIEPQVTSIIAIYHGGTVIEGNDVNSNDVRVTAYYSDGTFGEVTDFALSLTRLTGVGANTITVTYQKVTATITVICVPREVTGLEAVYQGPDVEVNGSISREYVVVTATFNDGGSEQVTDYILGTTLVTQLGANSFTITYGTKTATFRVYGIAGLVSGSGTIESEISNEEYDSITLTAIVQGQQIRENMTLDAVALEQDELKKLVYKTTKNGQYIGFEIDVEGYEFSQNQYMPVQITIPVGFDPAKVAVYYTPNRKSVMAKLSGGLIGSNIYEFYIYRGGTYILLECDKDTLSEAELRGYDDISPFIYVSGLKSTIKKGEKLNLKAAILHATSETDTNITWSVNEKSVAVITASGVLTAKAAGTVEVTAKTKDGKLEYKCEIEVTK